MAVSAKNPSITTIEGDEGLYDLAVSHFSHLGLQQIEAHNLPFEQFFEENGQFDYDFCFIDGKSHLRGYNFSL